MEYQPIKNSVQSKNGWTIGMPDGFNLFMNETEAILLDEDYDTVVAFIFDEDSVIVKKNRLASRAKNILQQKTSGCSDAA